MCLIRWLVRASLLAVSLGIFSQAHADGCNINGDAHQFIWLKSRTISQSDKCWLHELQIHSCEVTGSWGISEWVPIGDDRLAYEAGKIGEDPAYFRSLEAAKIRLETLCPTVKSEINLHNSPLELLQSAKTCGDDQNLRSLIDALWSTNPSSRDELLEIRGKLNQRRLCSNTVKNGLQHITNSK